MNSQIQSAWIDGREVVKTYKLPVIKQMSWGYNIQLNDYSLKISCYIFECC